VFRRSEKFELEKMIKSFYNVLGEKTNQLSTALAEIEAEE